MDSEDNPFVYILDHHHIRPPYTILSVDVNDFIALPFIAWDSLRSHQSKSGYMVAYGSGC